MIIAQISDTHLMLDTPDADRRMHDFASTIADINALDPAPDVIVHTGDIAHNGRAGEYARAAAILEAARAPVYVLAGNRDDRRNLRAAFSARGYLAPGADCIDFVVEDYPVRLIALDTLSPGDNKGEFSAAQAERLIAAIDAHKTKPVAVHSSSTVRGDGWPGALPFQVGGRHVAAAWGFAALRPGNRGLQRSCASRRRRFCRTNSRKRSAMHCDNASQGRISAVYAQPPGLSPAPIRSGLGFCHRNAAWEERAKLA